MLDLKGKAKWESWNNNKGKSAEAAQREYVALVQQLQGQ
jgi:acyl-CoA-binding protein